MVKKKGHPINKLQIPPRKIKQTENHECSTFIILDGSWEQKFQLTYLSFKMFHIFVSFRQTFDPGKKNILQMRSKNFDPVLPIT